MVENTGITRKDLLKGALAATALTALPATAATANTSWLYGAIGHMWWTNGRARNELGQPTTPEIRGPYDGVYQEFVGGRAYWHPARGATWVRHGGLFNYYHANGGTAGRFGYPVGNVEWNGRGHNGWSLPTWNPANGTSWSLEWESSVGPVPVYLSGAIGGLWNTDRNRYGFPVTAEAVGAGSSAYQIFSNGLMIWTPESGTRFYAGGQYQRTGAGNYLRRVDVTLGENDVLVLGDSQIAHGGRPEASWVGQGLRAAGWNTHFYVHGTIGIVNPLPAYAPSYVDGVVNNGWALPLGKPGLIYIGGSGNDAGYDFGAVIAGLSRLVEQLRAFYPGSKIIVSEVLSRRIAEQRRRHELSEQIRLAAGRLGLAGVVPTRYWVTDHGITPYLLDWVHLSDQGATALAPALTNWLKANGHIPVAQRRFTVFGGIGEYYHAHGGAARFGEPIQNEFASEGGAIQNFDKGWAIYWRPETGSHSVKWGTGIGDYYASQRWEFGPLGFPVSDEYDFGHKGRVQVFTNFKTGVQHLVIWSEESGTHAIVHGSKLYYEWLWNGGSSRLGYPVTDEIAGSGVTSMRFSGGWELSVASGRTQLRKL